MRTVEEIEKEMNGLEAERTALKSKLRVLEDERNVAIAAKELSEMPASKRKALEIAARGIPSDEKVGTPGKG